MISSDLSPLPDTEVHYLRSKDDVDELKILVGHSGPTGSVPESVLFMGDPWANFGTAVEIIRLLHGSGDIPPLLVVAVGYRVTTLEDNFPLRTRDFTPVVDAASARSGSDEMGGASRFLAFFRDRLKPWVRETYRVDTGDAALFGFSLGGLFATYVLLNEPDMFRRYGIGSPSLYWGEGLMFEQEAAYARAHDDLRAKVHLSVGAYENSDGDHRWLEQLAPDRRAIAEPETDPEAPYDLVADTRRMVTALRGRAYPSLDLEFEVFDGEYHHTAPPRALSRSIRYLFDAPR